MNLDKFTERSRGFIQAAQTIAQREEHARLGPEHLLKAHIGRGEALGITYSLLIPSVRRAIQQQQEIINDLLSRIEKLEKQ